MKIQRFLALCCGILVISLAIEHIASSANTKPVKNVQVLFVQNAAGYYGPALYNTSGSYRGAYGSASWSNGSGTATGWRGNTITWHRD